MTEIGKATPSGEKNYKPLKDQIAQLKKALKITYEGASKEVARQCQDMEKEVKKLCEDQQITMEDKIPLHSVFQVGAEKCEKRIKDLEEELEGGFKGRKVKAEKKLMMEKQSKYCKYVIVCRGVSPWMKDEVNDPTPGLAEEAQAEGRLYPSLKGLPSAPPPPYICPVLTLEGGTLWGPEGKTGTVKGGVVDFQEDPAPSMPVRVTEGVNKGVLQPRSAAATLKGTQLEPAAGTLKVCFYG